MLPAFVLLHPVHSRAQNGLNPQQLVIMVFTFHQRKQILHLHLPLAAGSLPLWHVYWQMCTIHTITIDRHCYLYCVVLVYTSSQKTVQSVIKSFLRMQQNLANTSTSVLYLCYTTRASSQTNIASGPNECPQLDWIWMSCCQLQCLWRLLYIDEQMVEF